MPSSSEKNLLRFGCPACGIRLVVDPSIAGTEGPCPSCGAKILAPPMEVHPSLMVKEAAPVAIKPRGISPSSSPPVDLSNAPVSNREPVSRPARKTRSVNPTTGMSQRHAEKQNAKNFIKILIAFLVVVAIVMTVYYLMQNAK